MSMIFSIAVFRGYASVGYHYYKFFGVAQLPFDFKCYICDGFLTERGNKGCNSWGCRVHVKAAFVSAQQDEPQVGA